MKAVLLNCNILKICKSYYIIKIWTKILQQFIFAAMCCSRYDAAAKKTINYTVNILYNFEESRDRCRTVLNELYYILSTPSNPLNLNAFAFLRHCALDVHLIHRSLAITLVWKMPLPLPVSYSKLITTHVVQSSNKTRACRWQFLPPTGHRKKRCAQLAIPERWTGTADMHTPTHPDGTRRKWPVTRAAWKKQSNEPKLTTTNCISLFSSLFPIPVYCFSSIFFIPRVCTASLSLRTAHNGTTVHRSNRTRTRNVYPQSREARCRTLRAVFRSYCRRACNRSGAVVPRPCSRPDRSVPVPVCFNSSVPAW